MSSQEVQSLPGVPVNDVDDGNEHDDDNNHGDDDDHDGDYDPDDDGVNLSPGQGVHPEPALQPPPRQRGGIGFIAHIEPLMIHDSHEDIMMNMMVGKTATSGLVTIFVTKMLTMVTLVTSGMVPSETKVPRIGILVPLFH